MRFRKKPVAVEAVQWWKNGDHPEDHIGESQPAPIGGGEYKRQEGAVVRFFRHPDYPGEQIHERCGRTWDDHGWIDTLEGKGGAQVVCPSDWIITGVEGEHYPIKDAIFRATYEPVTAPGPIDVGDTVDYMMPGIGPGTVPKRATGTVVRVHADGFLEAEFEQDAPSPMTVTGPAEAFTLVRTTRGGSDA